MAALVPQRGAVTITFKGVAVAAIAAADRVLTAIGLAEQAREGVVGIRWAVRREQRRQVPRDHGGIGAAGSLA